MKRFQITFKWSRALTGLALLAGVMVFARFFPPLTAVFSGQELYTGAWFNYSEATVFDRSIFTYGTDYLLAVVMGLLTVSIAWSNSQPEHQKLKLAAALLLGSYSLSTLAGAIAHQFLGGQMNSFTFRLVWNICVGSVCAGGAFMGAAASEITRLSRTTGQLRAGRQNGFHLPAVPHTFWAAWAVFFVLVNSLGFFSMQRVAADIFIVGVTQSIPTVYLVLSLLNRSHRQAFNLPGKVRGILIAGALTNTALLPLYDWFVFSGFSLGSINFILHTVLLFSWSAQGYGLLQHIRSSRPAAVAAESEGIVYSGRPVFNIAALKK